MAVPKRRQSKQRQRKRRTEDCLPRLERVHHDQENGRQREDGEKTQDAVRGDGGTCG